MGVTPHMYCCIPEVTVALAYRSSRQVDASTRLISPWNPFSRLQPVKAGPMITLVLYRCEASCLPLFLPQLSRTMIKCDPNHFSTGPGRWGHVWMCTGAQCWPSLCEDISSVHSSAADQASLDFQMSVLYVLCVCRRVGWQRSHFPGQTWSSQQCWKHSSSVFKSSSHLSLFSSKSSRLPISHTSLFLGGGWVISTHSQAVHSATHTHTRFKAAITSVILSPKKNAALQGLSKRRARPNCDFVFLQVMIVFHAVLLLWAFNSRSYSHEK